MSSEPASRSILALAHTKGALRPRDISALGITAGVHLQRLVSQGLLERVGRGVYILPGFEITEHHSLVEVATRAPQGVVCLLSALQFHELGTQLPFQVWLAIEGHAHRPTFTNPALRVVRMSGPAFHADIETHLIEGVPVRVYGAAKTVVDCFKFRNKVGIDVAVEALRDYVRKHPQAIGALWAPAQACRMTRIIRPYIEALL